MIFIIGDDFEGIKGLKQQLFLYFQTKNLDWFRYLLGIEVAQWRIKIAITQRKYALNILEQTGILDCRLVDAIIDTNVKLLPNQGELYSNPECINDWLGIELSHVLT